MSVLSEQEFRVKSDEALEDARRALLPLADTGEGFEVELQNGVLNLVFEEPSETKFVVSPNAPVRQIWVSAMARSYKLCVGAGARRLCARRRDAAAAARTPRATIPREHRVIKRRRTTQKKMNSLRAPRALRSTSSFSREAA